MSWDIFQGLCIGKRFWKNEPCLPGVVEEANWRIVEVRLRTTPAFLAMTPLTPPSAAPPADFASGSSIELPALVTPEDLCGAPDASKFSSYFGQVCYPYSGHDSGSYDLGYLHAAITPAPMTPDIFQATMTPAPTSPDPSLLLRQLR